MLFCKFWPCCIAATFFCGNQRVVVGGKKLLEALDGPVIEPANLHCIRNPCDPHSDTVELAGLRLVLLCTREWVQA